MKRKRDVFPQEIVMAFDGEGDNRVMLVGEKTGEFASADCWKDVGVYKLIRREQTTLETKTRIRK